MRTRRWFWLALLSSCCVMPLIVRAADGPLQAPAADVGEVDLFSAIENGQLQVAVIPQNYSVLTMRVRNNTATTLKVALPAVFAAVPTARWQTKSAALQQGASESLANNYMQNQGGSQGLGGSLAGPWAGYSLAGDQQGGQPANADNDQGRVWIIPGGKQFQIRVPCFCLEYGRPDPQRRIPYQFCQLKEFNASPAVRELLEAFGKGGWDQRIAQLAAWHVANGVPWQTLARIQIPGASGRRGKGFSQMELLAAKRLAESLPSYGQPSSLGDR